MIINIAGRQLDGIVQTRYNDTAWDGRESKAITTQMTYADAVALFGNDAPWSVTIEVDGDNGSKRQITQDMSEYAISGPITDNRDGTVTVRMGKYREEELMRIPLAAVPNTQQIAHRWRGIIEDAVQAISDDAVAIECMPLHPKWEELANSGVTVSAGYRFQHEGKLYKVMQSHTLASHWIPGSGTESLYMRIDETHAGTLEDPIPYSGNMELVDGMCYEQYGVIYLCKRSSGIALHNALADLVGLYVEVVS